MVVRLSRRTLLGSATAAVAATALASCSDKKSDSGSGAGSGGGITEIVFSYLWGGPEAQALEKIIAQFNASQSRIRVKGVSSPDFQKQLASMSASKGSFDLSDNFGNGVGAWAAKGMLAPLDDIYQAAGGQASAFVPATLEQMKYNGKLYSLPVAVHTFQLIYNKKLLEAAGVKPPTTTDELAAAIEKLTIVDGSGNIKQLGLGNPDIGSTLTTLGFAFGGSWDGSSGPTPDDPKNIEAVQFWQDHVIKKYGADKYAKAKAGWGQYMSAQDPFYTGKVAMIIDGEWQAVNIPKVAPSFEFGVADIPTPTAATYGTTQVTTSTLFIPANAPHKAEAAAFLKYITDKGAMGDLTRALGNLPSRQDLLSGDSYKAIPHFDQWLKSLTSDKVKALSSAPYGAQYAQDLSSAWDSVAQNKMSAADALKAVAEKAKAYSNG